MPSERRMLSTTVDLEQGSGELRHLVRFSARPYI